MVHPVTFGVLAVWEIPRTDLFTRIEIEREREREREKEKVG